MERWTPNKQILESPSPNGSEDVAFKKTPHSATIVKAHAFVLAKLSKVFADKIYPLSEGQSFPIVISGWTNATENEEALKAFVKMLYGTGPDFTLLDMEKLIGVHSLSQHYRIPGLATDLIERIKNAPIPLSEIPGYITFAWQRRQCSEEKQAEAVSSNIALLVKAVNRGFEMCEKSSKVDV